MGIPRGQFTSVVLSVLDNVRVTVAQKKATAGYKKSRKRRRRIRKGVKDEIQQAEVDEYEPGIANCLFIR